ncbi:MAG TPA: CocE/NonD family hydrolase [Devosiaceae bacterium]|nr:CocE/NonD family hydrolase [Devosiaceae bacterium]
MQPELVVPGMIVLRDVMVTMRDGIQLATDIYLPEAAGVASALPVVLERTPYGKALPSRAEIELGMPGPMSRAEVAARLVLHGYAVVYQDCRGRYRSEGVFAKYVSDGADGYDTMTWIMDQPWCNGRIGTMGLSYAAHTQLALACLNPPGLACMVLDSGGFSNAFTCGIRQGGAFELKQATWAFKQAQESREAAADPNVLRALEAENVREWFKVMPWSEGRSPVRWLPDYENYLLDQWRRGSFDDYWKQNGIYAAESYDTIPDIPIALMSSWYDVYVRTTLENFAGLSRNGKRPLTLVMGPWTHGNRNALFSGDTDFGSAAAFDGNVAPNWLDFRIEWFNRWLLGQENGTAPMVRYFLMGGGSGNRLRTGRLDHGGKWLSAEAWPPAESQALALYLHNDGRLRPSEPDEAAAPVSYDFDPAHPVPTIGGSLTSGQPVFEGGGYDQRETARFFGCEDTGLPLSARLDVLSFETEPLEQDLAVVGPVTIELWVASSALDTDFTAKLVDVYPPSEEWPRGFALNVTDGIFRCRYRHSFKAPAPIEAGEIFPITIEPFATANLFKKGHRIRLDVSSSNFPKFDVNPNTGGPEGQDRTRIIARNTVFCDATRSSWLRLSVLKA